MKREIKIKQAEDYKELIAREMIYYAQMAESIGISTEVLTEAAQLGVRDGIFRHRRSDECKFREEECVAWSIRHMIDLTLARACLLASTEEEMESAEAVLMRLIED